MAKITPLKKVFGETKPIIGMIHLLPLPGSPRYAGKISEIIDRACKDAETLQEGGVDGVIVENYGDLPFFEQVPSETVAAMAAIAMKIKGVIDLPIGINVLRNDGVAAISIAAAIDADFIRVNVHTGVVLTEQGLIPGCAAEIARQKACLRTKALIFADVAVKHGRGLIDVPIGDLVRETILRGLADGVILTGKATGLPTDLKIVRQVKGEIPEITVLVGSGVSEGDVGKILDIADGVIVGTSIKVDACVSNPVDLNRVRNFVRVVRG